MEERDYLVLLQQNSEEAFKYLYHRYAPRLYGFVYNLTESSYVAKEIVQETFIKIWERRSEVRPELSFKSYLFMIAKNHTLNSFRNKLLTDDIAEYSNLQNEIRLSGNDIEQQLEFQDLKDYIENLKKYLTPRQRQIFELSKEKLLSNKEIADLLGIDERSVKNQLSASIRTLRKYFDENTWALFLLILYFIKY